MFCSGVGIREQLEKGGNAVLKGANIAGMVVVDEDISDLSIKGQQLPVQRYIGGIGPLGTVRGDAGSSWVYLNRIDTLKSQASYGISLKDTIAYLSWGLSYSDGNSAQGVAVPLSKDWSGTTVKNHQSANFITVVFIEDKPNYDDLSEFLRELRDQQW